MFGDDNLASKDWFSLLDGALGTSSQGRFYLTNLLGQTCLTVDLQSGHQQESVIISSLPEGFYSWHVLNDGKVAFQGSLIIQR